MTKSMIKINVEGVLDLADEIDGFVSQVGSQRDYVQSLLRTVDPEVLSRHNIRERLNAR